MLVNDYVIALSVSEAINLMSSGNLSLHFLYLSKMLHNILQVIINFEKCGQVSYASIDFTYQYVFSASYRIYVYV